jgi:hypothetical protein
MRFRYGYRVVSWSAALDALGNHTVPEAGYLQSSISKRKGKGARAMSLMEPIAARQYVGNRAVAGTRGID